MDRLTAVLHHFQPTATSVYRLGLEGTQTLPDLPRGTARLCLLKSGQAELSDGSALHEGELLWLTRQQPMHWSGQALLVICELRFGQAQLNPLLDKIPDCIRIAAEQDDAAQTLGPVIDLMVHESLHPECGQAHVQHRLAEVLLVRVLRFLMRNAVLHDGVIGGLSDVRLARAIPAANGRWIG